MRLTKYFLLMCGLIGLIFIGNAFAYDQNGLEAAKLTAFDDVKLDDANITYINYLSSRGWIKAYPDGSFKPLQGVTRAEAATMVTRILGLDNSVVIDKFQDVDAQYWAAGSISAATQAGILKGYPDGTFHPERLISRAEGMALFLRLAEDTLVDQELANKEQVDSDDWAAGPLAVAVSSGMLQPQGSEIKSEEPLTRGEMARALGVLLTKEPQLARVDLLNSFQILQGKVTISDAQGQEIKNAGDRILQPGDMIRTADNGIAQIGFPDGTSILIKENTTLRVHEALGRSYIKVDGNPGTAVEWLHLELKQGEIYGDLATWNRQMALEYGNSKENVLLSITNKNNPQDQVKNSFHVPWWKYFTNSRVRVKVDMPWGVASVRGTIWSNVVYPNGNSKVTVLSGHEDVTSGGQTVSLSAGESTEILARDAKPTPKARMTKEDNARWDKVAGWINEQEKQIEKNKDLNAEDLQEQAVVPDKKELPEQATAPDKKDLPEPTTIPDKKALPESTTVPDKKALPEPTTIPDKKVLPAPTTVPDTKVLPEQAIIPDITLPKTKDIKVKQP